MNHDPHSAYDDRGRVNSAFLAVVIGFVVLAAFALCALGWLGLIVLLQVISGLQP